MVIVALDPKKGIEEAEQQWSGRSIWSSFLLYPLSKLE
jgi:hypothetical protein